MKNGNKENANMSNSDNSALVAAILQLAAVQMTIHYNEHTKATYKSSVNAFDHVGTFERLVVKHFNDVHQDVKGVMA